MTCVAAGGQRSEPRSDGAMREEVIVRNRGRASRLLHSNGGTVEWVLRN